MNCNMTFDKDLYEFSQQPTNNFGIKEDFINQYLFNEDQSQIEYFDNESNSSKYFQMSVKTYPRPQSMYTSIISPKYLDQQEVSDPIFMEGEFTFLKTNENDEDKHSSIFHEDSSKSETHSNSSNKTRVTPQNKKKKQIKKANKIQNSTVNTKSKSKLKPVSNISAPVRKGKHSQSPTQKFIHFMTHYHYSKNFSQYFNKKVTQKVGNYIKFSVFQPNQKIAVVDQIIAELEQYQMAVHYQVEEGAFMNSFGVEQRNLIRQLFWQVVQRTYRIRLEWVKEEIQSGRFDGKPSVQKFFDEKGQRQFNKIFEEILATEPFSSILGKCNFQSRLEAALNKKARL